MSKILVIGATGLLGRPVSRALELRGHEVHRASRRLEASEASHRLDLANVDETERALSDLRPDVVIQMTGGVARDPVGLAQINIVPTVNLLVAAARSNTQPAIFVSGSAAEYGDPGGEQASEDSPLRPLSPYGWMKVAETSTSAELARLHGLGLTIVRPFNPVTPELPRTTALGNFRHQVLEGTGRMRKVVCGRVDVLRDFVTGSFVGEAMADLVVNPPGGVVNICSGVGIRLESVMRAAAEILDVELELEQDPELVGLPAPSSIVGNPERLHGLVAARANSTPESLATELLDRSAE